MKLDETITRRTALDDVSRERDRQDRKWGPLLQREFGVEEMLPTLGEEFSEVCKAICEQKPDDLRTELIHVAAVAVAAVQWIDAKAHDVRVRT